VGLDEDPIIVSTAHTFDELKVFQRFNSRKIRYFLIALLLLILFLSSANADTMPILETFLFLGIFAAIFLFVSGIFYTKNQYERATKTLSNGLTFHFKNSQFDVINEHPDYAAQGYVPYERIHRIYETDTMFYIYVNREKAFLISKSGIQNTDPARLRIILKSKVAPQIYKSK